MRHSKLSDKRKSKVKMALLAAFQHVLEIIGNVIRQENEIKHMQSGKEEINWFFVGDDMIEKIQLN